MAVHCFVSIVISLAICMPCQGKVLSSSLTKLSDFAEAVGINTVITHFPNAADLSCAIDFEWARRTEHAQESYPYIACSSLSQAPHTYYSNNDIVAFSTFASIERDLYCDTIYLNAGEVASVEASDVVLTLLEPLPEALKLDTSVIHALNWIHSGRAAGRAAAQNSHPIINHLFNSDSVELTVLYRQEISQGVWPVNGDKTHRIDSWIDALSGSFGHSIVHCSICHGSVLGRQRLSLTKGGIMSSRRKLPSHYASNLLPATAGLSSHRPEWWLQWADQWTASTPDVCEASSVQFEARRDEVVISLPDGTRASAACLSRLVSILASTPEVTRVAMTMPKQVQNDYSRGAIQSGVANMEPFTTVGLTGHGVVIGQSDTGVDDLSCFFVDDHHGQTPRSTMEHPTTHLEQRKVIQYVNYSSNGDVNQGHGTHTAGILVGNCLNSTEDASEFNGVGAGAKLAFFDLGLTAAQGGFLKTPDDISDIFPPSHQGAGAKLHSNSWGGGYWYDSYAHQVDRYLYDNPDFLAIFAAGNQGRNGAHTVLSPSLSKNALSVAASGDGRSTTDDVDKVAFFSSQGPAPDGRIKPDVTGPGISIISAKAHDEVFHQKSCETHTKSGTSMAAPAVAGAAAIIHEYFMTPSIWQHVCIASESRCRDTGVVPSGVLTKTLLIHSGKSINSPSTAPDFKQGFGRVQLDQLLPLAPAQFQLYTDERDVEKGHQIAYSIDIDPFSTHSLKVSLSWFDPPCTEFSAKVLLHDLDLVVVDPQERLHFGNGHSNGQALIGAKRDVLNNNEQVVISSPGNGTWTVLVQAKLLPKSPIQRYAVVITTDVKNNISTPAASTAVEKELLDRCHIGSGINPGFKAYENRSAVDVTLFDFWPNELWSTDRGVKLSTKNDSINLHAAVSPATVLDTAIAVSDAYDFDTACLAAGCYEAELQWNRTSSGQGSSSIMASMGLLAYLPQCDAFLSPLLMKQEICIDEAIMQQTESDGSSSLTRVLRCRTLCERRDHVLLDIALQQTLEEGWLGSYYTVHKSVGVDDRREEASWQIAGEGEAVSGGTMEWGLDESRNICLAAQARCYEVILWTQDNRDVHYANVDPPERTDRDPDPSPSLIFNEHNTDVSCPHKLQSNVSVARVCTDGFSHANITFYATTLNSNDDLGGVESQDVHERIVKFYGKAISRCEHVPITFKSSYPELIRATSDGHSGECLQSCFHSLSSDLFQHSVTDMCLVLGNAFGTDCGDVAVRAADTRCPGVSAVKPDCASSCAATSWCYYAAVNARLCPVQHTLSNMLPAEVDLLHSDILELTEKCQTQWRLNEPPSSTPTSVPSAEPTAISESPSSFPTINPTTNTGAVPTLCPTIAVESPTAHPTTHPTLGQGGAATPAPTLSPTALPSLKSTLKPSAEPTAKPSYKDSGDDYRNDDISIPDLEHPVDSISGGGQGDSSLGGATSSTIAIAIVAALGCAVAVCALVQRWVPGASLWGDSHSLLRNSSDHGDDEIIFSSFGENSRPSASFMSSTYGRISGSRLGPGIELGNVPPGQDDDDAIMEITL